MKFLHESDFKVHGNLKSKNCVVNSRWTVKLQDFYLFTQQKYQWLPEANAEKNCPVDYSGTEIIIIL